MAVMFKAETKRIIEGLLFVANGPLSLETLVELTEIEAEDVESLVQELVEDYQKELRGMQIVEVAGGYQMATIQEMAPYIERLYRPQGSYGLSKAALETLAIVAYKQPITRGEIELIRGVKVDKAISSLQEKGLIKEVGRKEGPGRPVLFGVTSEFLQHFGLKDVNELPSLDELIVHLEEGETLELGPEVEEQQETTEEVETKE